MERIRQWECLKERKQLWGEKWVMWGDFNERNNNEEKKGGRTRQESSFTGFRTFISEMGMEDISYRGRTFTWANNREEEGFIQDRLDRFLGSVEWMLHFDTAEVTHILRQVSNHSLLILDTQPQRVKTSVRFIFDSRWTKLPECEEIIKKEWQKPACGSRIFSVQQKLK